MTFVWNPVGLAGIVAGSMLMILAWVVYAARPRARQNVILALYLMVAGFILATWGGIRLFFADPRDALAMGVAGTSLLVVLGGLRIALMATFESPLVSWIRRTRLDLVAILVSAALAIDVIIRTESWIPGVRPLSSMPGWSVLYTPLMKPVSYAAMATFLLTAIAAVDVWRRVRAPLARRQAAVLAITFTTQAVLGIGFHLWSTTRGGGSLGRLEVLNFLWIDATYLILGTGLAYGILTAQVFDIDLKIKWTLRKGTIAAAFVGVFFVVSEGAQTVLSERLGPVAGLLAAGALVFAIAPLQRFADRIGDVAMPRVQDSPAYRLVMKREVYRAAVESALEGGDITPKERGMLAALADQLAMGPKEMHEIEREARAGRAGAAG